MDCDDWPAAAAKDDTMVVDLLLKLKRSAQTSTRRESKTKVTGLIQFRWGRRKARTRPDVTRFAMCKEFKERANRSPTTPLSWSTGGCGTTSVSGSGNVDGFEASSMMCGRANGSRSKVCFVFSLCFFFCFSSIRILLMRFDCRRPLLTALRHVVFFRSRGLITQSPRRSPCHSVDDFTLNRLNYFPNLIFRCSSGSENFSVVEVSSNAVVLLDDVHQRFSTVSSITAASAYELVNDKKAKRKKTYSELKKEERLLLDEKLHLKRDLANMHASLTHHRNTNQNLKRIKSMNVHSRTVTPSITQHPVSCAHIQTLTTEGLIFKFQDSNSNNEIPQPSFSSNNVSGTKDNKSLTLPDLNMLPATE